MATLPLLAPAVCRAAVLSGPEIAGDFMQIYAIAGELFDSNVFRIPHDAALYGVRLPAEARRSDDCSILGGGLEAAFNPARQAISLDGQLTRVSYDHNAFLNHTAGSANLSWDWQAGATLNGTVAASYGKSIADFVNNRVYQRDPIETNEERAALRWDAAAHLRLQLSADTHATDHQVQLQKYQDNRTGHYAAQAGYVFGPQNELGVIYRQAQADFADPQFSYRDRSVLGKLDYFISGNTSFKLDSGWYRRVYDHGGHANYSGAAAHFLLQWQPTSLTTVRLAANRELTAYLHNQADYYLNNELALNLTWSPRAQWSMDLSGSLARQDYRGAGLGALDIVRQDHLRVITLKGVWSPYRWLELNLSDSYEDRRSTDNYFSYTDDVATVRVRLIW